MSMQVEWIIMTTTHFHHIPRVMSHICSQMSSICPDLSVTWSLWPCLQSMCQYLITVSRAHLHAAVDISWGHCLTYFLPPSPGLRGPSWSVWLVSTFGLIWSCLLICALFISIGPLWTWDLEQTDSKAACFESQLSQATRIILERSFYKLMQQPCFLQLLSQLLFLRALKGGCWPFQCTFLCLGP